jgi:hypothetical protein
VIGRRLVGAGADEHEGASNESKGNERVSGHV